MRGSFCPPLMVSLILARTLGSGMPPCSITLSSEWFGALVTTGSMSSIAASMPAVAVWQRASIAGSPV